MAHSSQSQSRALLLTVLSLASVGVLSLKIGKHAVAQEPSYASEEPAYSAEPEASYTAAEPKDTAAYAAEPADSLEPPAEYADMAEAEPVTNSEAGSVDGLSDESYEELDEWDPDSPGEMPHERKRSAEETARLQEERRQWEEEMEQISTLPEDEQQEFWREARELERRKHIDTDYGDGTHDPEFQAEIARLNDWHGPDDPAPR